MVNHQLIIITFTGFHSSCHKISKSHFWEALKVLGGLRSLADMVGSQVRFKDVGEQDDTLFKYVFVNTVIAKWNFSTSRLSVPGHSTILKMIGLAANSWLNKPLERRGALTEQSSCLFTCKRTGKLVILGRQYCTLLQNILPLVTVCG